MYNFTIYIWFNRRLLEIPFLLLVWRTVIFFWVNVASIWHTTQPSFLVWMTVLSFRKKKSLKFYIFWVLETKTLKNINWIKGKNCKTTMTDSSNGFKWNVAVQGKYKKNGIYFECFALTTCFRIEMKIFYWKCE